MQAGRRIEFEVYDTSGSSSQFFWYESSGVEGRAPATTIQAYYFSSDQEVFSHEIDVTLVLCSSIAKGCSECMIWRPQHI